VDPAEHVVFRRILRVPGAGRADHGDGQFASFLPSVLW